MKEIKIINRKKELYFIQVDDEDYEKLNKYKWHVSKSKFTRTPYVYRQERIDKKVIKIAMHRFLMNIQNTELIIDHIDGNGLNNQKSNLRVATVSQNSANKIGKGFSKYLGVYYHNYHKKWIADCSKHGKRQIKYYKTEIEAAIGYNKMAIITHGEFAKLNIIQDEIEN